MYKLNLNKISLNSLPQLLHHIDLLPNECQIIVDFAYVQLFLGALWLEYSEFINEHFFDLVPSVLICESFRFLERLSVNLSDFSPHNEKPEIFILSSP